jgi:hypothetical protein
MNTFGYVDVDPLARVDFFGLTSKRKTVSLGDGYSGEIDMFNNRGSASFEMHVYNKRGKEVGVYGPNGWISKHGYKGRPEGIPESVEAHCQAEAADILRRMGVASAESGGQSRGSKLAKYLRGVWLIGPLMEATKPSQQKKCEINPEDETCRAN